jgi:hypothetical protein
MRAFGVQLNDLTTGFRGVRREDENYTPWTTEDCFWHPAGATCAWLTHSWDRPGSPTSELDGGGGVISAAPGTDSTPTQEDLHNHGAGALKTSFYDPISAARITGIYRADFDMLGYPPWDGGSGAPPT